MAIQYVCRHCSLKIGEVGDNVTEFQLGFHFLTPEERRDIITYNPEGGITVNVVCDYCKQALEEHPELSLVGSPLQ